jgi:hypothetical protein
MSARGDDERRNERIRANRHGHTGTTSEGGYELHLGTTAAAGVNIEAALNPFRELAFEAARKAGRRETYAAITADAVELWACATIGTTPTCLHPSFGQDDTPPAADQSPGATVIPWEPTGAGVKLPAGNRINITVLVDHTALVRGHTVAGDTCEIAGYGPIPVTAVHELMATGDPFYAALVKKGEDLVGGVHLGRDPTALQRTAVIAKTKGVCSIAGCTNTICEIDHHHDWTHCRKTCFNNLGLLCTQVHHPMKTAGGTLWIDDHGDAHLTPPPNWDPDQPTGPKP